MAGVGGLAVGAGPVGGEFTAASTTIQPDVASISLSVEELNLQRTARGDALFVRGARALLTERGIRFANAPGGRSDLVVHGGERVQHINSVSTVMNLPASINREGTYSGVIKFRFRSYKSFPVPASVRRE